MKHSVRSGVGMFLFFGSGIGVVVVAMWILATWGIVYGGILALVVLLLYLGVILDPILDLTFQEPSK